MSYKSRLDERTQDVAHNNRPRIDPVVPIVAGGRSRLLAMADFMVILDASIVNIALPSIGRGLHISLSNLSWVVNAYVLTFGGFLLLGGRIADLLGRRLIFIVGLGVFSLASLTRRARPERGCG